MGDLNTREQKTVRDWYDRIGTPPMKDATPAQIAWMQARHYPMPADIARAASMSESELKAEADGVDITARILYIARLLTSYHAHQSAGVSWNDPIQLHLLDEISRMMPEVLASGSPFAGYLFAAKDRLMHPEDVESIASAQLAGLVWASKFGDIRAKRLLDSPAVQAVNGTVAGAAITLMLKTAMHRNPALFSIAVLPIPPSGY